MHEGASRRSAPLKTRRRRRNRAERFQFSRRFPIAAALEVVHEGLRGHKSLWEPGAVDVVPQVCCPCSDQVANRIYNHMLERISEVDSIPPSHDD